MLAAGRGYFPVATAGEENLENWLTRNDSIRFPLNTPKDANIAVRSEIRVRLTPFTKRSV